MRVSRDILVRLASVVACNFKIAICTKMRAMLGGFEEDGRDFGGWLGGKAWERPGVLR